MPPRLAGGDGDWLMQRMWVGGQWTGSVSKKTFPIDNPATEEIIDEVPRAGAADADLAVESAAEAFRDWRGVPGIERAALMHEFATRLRAKAGAVARRLTLEGGKPLIENLDRSNGAPPASTTTASWRAIRAARSPRRSSGTRSTSSAKSLTVSSSPSCPGTTRSCF